MRGALALFPFRGHLCFLWCTRVRAQFHYIFAAESDLDLMHDVMQWTLKVSVLVSAFVVLLEAVLLSIIVSISVLHLSYLFPVMRKLY